MARPISPRSISCTIPYSSSANFRSSGSYFNPVSSSNAVTASHNPLLPRLDSMARFKALVSSSEENSEGLSYVALILLRVGGNPYLISQLLSFSDSRYRLPCQHSPKPHTKFSNPFQRPSWLSPHSFATR